jgi:hypothetical protein
MNKLIIFFILFILYGLSKIFSVKEKYKKLNGGSMEPNDIKNFTIFFRSIGLILISIVMLFYLIFNWREM